MEEQIQEEREFEEPQKEAKIQKEPQKDDGLFELGFGEVGESTKNNLDFGLDF